MSDVYAGALVCWANGGDPAWGVISSVGNNGKSVDVHLDGGNNHTFAWPNETLQHVELDVGQPVLLTATSERGVVAARTDAAGKIFYSVSLATGGQKTVAEDGVRIAVETDPIARLRQGILDTARSTNLRLAATRLLFSHQYDELSSLSNSRVEIKPHQVGVLHRVATAYPHRFILADEVGLGKTIEAGLIIKELKARGFAERVLVLTPSGIVSQWQYELKTKFNQVFANYQRNTIDFLTAQHPGENVWSVNDNVIASTSFAAANDDRMRDIALAGWDLVVIDEAHHARRTYQGEHKYTETRLYKLAEMLADLDLGRAQAFLLLTATPMQLHRFELFSLIELLDPTLFPTFEDFDAHADALAGLNATSEAVRRWPLLTAGEKKSTLDEVKHWLPDEAELPKALENAQQRSELVDALADKHRLSNVMVRNRKKVVGGFMPRVAALWPVHMTPEEREAYDAASDYARMGYARAKATKNNALGFLMVIFQKLNTSSSYALRQSLLRRIEKLEAGLRVSKEIGGIDETDLEEQRVEDALGDMLGAGNAADDLTRAEIAELETIVHALDRIRLDSKAMVLVEKLTELAAQNPDEKVIVFTQFRDTQEYIAGHVPELWIVNLFHGQLKPSEKDAAVSRFREGHGPQILITTEAGGEGRNFQFCNILINYDLPWNPMKVEQRIGRIDRIGQKKTVKIFNFSTQDTVEERVVSVLSDRIRVFEQTIGGLDPILGEVELDLRKIFLLADEEAKRALASLESQLEIRVEQARRTEERLADLIMDAKSFRKDEVDELLEHHGSSNNVDLRRFVINALADLDVRVSDDRELEDVYFLTFSDRFFACFPQFVRDDLKRRVTFSASVALEHEEIDFLAFGHQLVDGLVARVRSDDYGGRSAARVVLTDEVTPAEGWFFVYGLEFGGIVPSKELLPIFVHVDGRRDDELAVWLLQRAARGKREDIGAAVDVLPERAGSFESAVSDAEQIAIGRLVSRQAELSESNQQRLVRDRAKLERFYLYREQAAADRLAGVENTFTKLAASEDPAVLRVLPVWKAKVEQARRAVAQTQEERERRLGALIMLDHVAPQHERLTACYVTIAQDAADSLARSGLRVELLDRVRTLARPTTQEELAEKIAALRQYASKLTALAEKHGDRFDSDVAQLVADRLEKVARRSDLDDTNRALVRAAIDYFVLVNDSEPDLHPGGFADDRAVADAVIAAVTRS